MATPEELEAAEKAAKEEVEKKAAEEKLKAEEEAKKQKDFDSWLASQPENIRSLYDEHVGGLKSALKKERETNQTNKGALEKLAKIEDEEKKRKEAELSEIEKATKRAETAEKEAVELKLNLKRREIAAKLKLPEILVDRIKGETPEDMEADAKKLMDELPKVNPKLGETNPGGGQIGTETREQTMVRLGLK